MIRPPNDPTGAEGPEWRDRRFRIEHILVPVPPRIWDVEDIGVQSLSAEGLPPHLTVCFVRVPEGLLMLASCGACGGRREGLVDFRPAAALEDQRPESYQPLVERALLTVATPVLHEWVPAHEGCDATPHTYTMPSSVGAFIDAAVRDVRWDLAAGRRPVSAVHVLLSDESSFSYLVSDVPEPRLEDHGLARTRELTMRAFAAREIIASRALDAQAVVVVAEAWQMTPEALAAGAAQMRGGGSPISRTEREKCLVVSAVVEHVGRIGIAPIRYRRPGRWTGPASLGELAWHPASGRLQVCDGILATPIVVPRGP